MKNRAKALRASFPGQSLRRCSAHGIASQTMMSPKKLVKKLKATSRGTASTGRSSVADKGHFVAYTADCERFVLPLTYLSNPIFQAMLEVSEDEYGLPGNGPIMLPCDGACMEYLISLMQRSLSEDVQKALLVSITTDRCLTSSSAQQELTQQLLVSTC
ncbi:hypothetical protein H6P81_019061 [Aristolochia fimbriata]|uniref:Small auxin up regulated protein n=1 Tax=Aristolochia fimbriata TaxID=158543 RepID=A0AAV7E5V2_ARIFI|nr:hypothetical protein H6P81_019061 [Aristolochia fimbriata]